MPDLRHRVVPAQPGRHCVHFCGPRQLRERRGPFLAVRLLGRAVPARHGAVRVPDLRHRVVPARHGDLCVPTGRPRQLRERRGPCRAVGVQQGRVPADHWPVRVPHMRPWVLPARRGLLLVRHGQHRILRRGRRAERAAGLRGRAVPEPAGPVRVPGLRRRDVPARPRAVVVHRRDGGLLRGQHRAERKVDLHRRAVPGADQAERVPGLRRRDVPARPSAGLLHRRDGWLLRGQHRPEHDVELHRRAVPRVHQADRVPGLRQGHVPDRRGQGGLRGR